jgi:hypothetical protein
MDLYKELSDAYHALDHLVLSKNTIHHEARLTLPHKTWKEVNKSADERPQSIHGHVTHDSQEKYMLLKLFMHQHSMENKPKVELIKKSSSRQAASRQKLKMLKKEALALSLTEKKASEKKKKQPPKKLEKIKSRLMPIHPRTQKLPAPKEQLADPFPPLRVANNPFQKLPSIVHPPKQQSLLETHASHLLPKQSKKFNPFEWKPNEYEPQTDLETYRMEYYDDEELDEQSEMFQFKPLDTLTRRKSSMGSHMSLNMNRKQSIKLNSSFRHEIPGLQQSRNGNLFLQKDLPKAYTRDKSRAEELGNRVKQQNAEREKMRPKIIQKERRLGSMFKPEISTRIASNKTNVQSLARDRRPSFFFENEKVQILQSLKSRRKSQAAIKDYLSQSMKSNYQGDGIDPNENNTMN